MKEYDDFLPFIPMFEVYLEPSISDDSCNFSMSSDDWNNHNKNKNDTNNRYNQNQNINGQKITMNFVEGQTSEPNGNIHPYWINRLKCQRNHNR